MIMTTSEVFFSSCQNKKAAVEFKIDNLFKKWKYAQPSDFTSAQSGKSNLIQMFCSHVHKLDKLKWHKKKSLLTVFFLSDHHIHM